MKLRVLAASLAALTLTAGIASAQTKPAAPAPAAAPAAAGAVDKTHASYAFGWSLGQDLVNSGEPIDIASVVRGVQDAYAKKQPAYTEQQLGAAYSGFQQRVQKKMEDAFKKALVDNQAQSAKFITDYKAQPGVITLPSGIMYRVAKAGTGAKATANSQVQIAFRSFLGAVCTPLMQQGAVWEVVVPPGKGTGDQNQQFAQQAIAIQVELGSVK